MPEIIMDMVKYFGVTLIIGISFFHIFKSQPKKVKIGNLVEAEWVDKETGSIQLNLDGSKKIVIAPEIIEHGIITARKSSDAVHEDYRGYIENSKSYAREKIKSLAFDIKSKLDMAAETTTDKNLMELININCEMIKIVLEHKLMEALVRSFLINGFYEMAEIIENRKVFHREWEDYIDLQAETIYNIVKATIGTHIGFVQITQAVKDKAEKNETSVAEVFMKMAGHDFETIKKICLSIYSAAWNYQHAYKTGKHKAEIWEHKTIKSTRETGKYLTPEAVEDGTD